MRGLIADAERSLSDLSHLFKAEQERVSKRCIERRDTFQEETIPKTRRQLHDALIEAEERWGPGLHNYATEVAQMISRRLLHQRLAEQRPAAEAM